LGRSSPLVERIADELAKCNRCGFCQTRCPVYRVTGREASVARGHVARVTAAAEGEVPFEEVRESLFSCLMCRACTAECPPAIKTDQVVFAARANYLAERQSPLQRFVFRTVLGNPRLLRTGAWAMGLLKRSGLTAFSKLLRALPWLDRGYAEAPTWMPAPKTFLRERLAKRKASGGHPPSADTRPTPTPDAPRVLYFVGCAIDCALPEAGEATVELLEAAGCEVSVASNVCCGLPPYAYGDLESARALARKNLAALRGEGTETIITDCASCASFLRDYPELFEEGDPDRAAAQEVAGRVRDLSQFLLERSRPESFGAEASEATGAPVVVTYHDPCHLSRYQGITREPRELLQAIPGIEFRELPEADWCCGGAGSYSMCHYEVSMQILERKMSNIRATGASIVVTPCPACILQLRYGAQRFGVPVEVVHLSEMLRRAKGMAAREALGVR
jgi:glycolate oxidase iron-sulfur subunit